MVHVHHGHGVASTQAGYGFIEGAAGGQSGQSVPVRQRVGILDRRYDEDQLTAGEEEVGGRCVVHGDAHGSGDDGPEERASYRLRLEDVRDSRDDGGGAGGQQRRRHGHEGRRGRGQDGGGSFGPEQEHGGAHRHLEKQDGGGDASGHRQKAPLRQRSQEREVQRHQDGDGGDERGRVGSGPGHGGVRSHHDEQAEQNAAPPEPERQRQADGQRAGGEDIHVRLNGRSQ